MTIIKTGNTMQALNEMRQSIDNIDSAIFAMLTERFKITNRVGHYKAENGLNFRDRDREAIQFQSVELLAQSNGLDIEFVNLI